MAEGACPGLERQGTGHADRADWLGRSGRNNEMQKAARTNSRPAGLILSAEGGLDTILAQLVHHTKLDMERRTKANPAFVEQLS